MDFKELGKTLLDKAPLLGSLFGAPGVAAGTAVKLVAGALGLNPEKATADEMAEVIRADPQAMVKIREIEAAHAVRLRELLIESDRMYLQDRQSARLKSVEETKATGKRDTNLYALAWLIVLGFFCLTATLMFRSVPEGSNQAIFMLFGGLVGSFGSVVAFFFGSSKSSQDKTGLLTGKKE